VIGAMAAGDLGISAGGIGDVESHHEGEDQEKQNQVGALVPQERSHAFS
jgi:hypothetical protein